ncbi:MAG: head-tail connector protein [Ancalomicrobiaceae bacterium]|nr:head-tail connector protein [Ancalomicrobiaceae bacterium]
MTAALIMPPAIEPVLIIEAKAHLKVEIADDDDLIGALVTAARIHVEAATRRVLITQSWRIYRDDWPENGEVHLPVSPLQSVDEVIVYDASGEPVTLDAAQYQVDIASVPARLKLRASPATLQPGEPLNGIEIDVTAGYGTSGVAVPQPLRLAIMMLVARWYEFRDATAIGTVPASVAPGFEALIAPYRVLRLS